MARLTHWKKRKWCSGRRSCNGWPGKLHRAGKLSGMCDRHSVVRYFRVVPGCAASHPLRGVGLRHFGRGSFTRLVGRVVSLWEISRDLHVSRNTVRKILRSEATEFHYEREVQPLPIIGPWSNIRVRFGITFGESLFGSGACGLDYPSLRELRRQLIRLAMRA
jgi:hypothetical protein